MNLTAIGFIVDAIAVENEGAVRRVDAHGHRPLLKERQLQRRRISGCHVGVTLDLCDKLRRVNVAKAILVGRKHGQVFYWTWRKTEQWRWSACSSTFKSRTPHSLAAL